MSRMAHSIFDAFSRLFTAKDVEKYLSAAILDPETVYQKADNGMTFPELLTSKGIVPGVKPHRETFHPNASKASPVFLQLRTVKCARPRCMNS
jgi:fructose-bisphosphate aldolase class 1